MEQFNAVAFDLESETEVQEPFGSLLLALVIPTRNEVDALALLFPRLLAALDGISAEVVFVDDSDDETPVRIAELGARPGLPFPIRLIHREPGQRSGGLSTAVLEGFRVSRARWVCVMDADLQHPPEMIAPLLSTAQRRFADVVVASRYCQDGASDLSFGRHLVSLLSTRIASRLFPERLHAVSDPMSGFFVVRRSALAVRALRPNGFKILMEILVRSPQLRIIEVPFSMGERNAGESKGSLSEGMRFVEHLLRLRVATMTSRDRLDTRR